MMIRFATGVYAIVHRYSLSIGIQALSHSLLWTKWELWGSVNKGRRLLDGQSTAIGLSDRKVHIFEVTGDDQGIPRKAVRLCQPDRNGLGTSQIHLTSFILTGDVIGPLEMIRCQDERINRGPGRQAWSKD
jgi:hypothetical protein